MKKHYLLIHNYLIFYYKFEILNIPLEVIPTKPNTSLSWTLLVELSLIFKDFSILNFEFMRKHISITDFLLNKTKKIQMKTSTILIFFQNIIPLKTHFYGIKYEWLFSNIFSIYKRIICMKEVVRSKWVFTVNKNKAVQFNWSIVHF